MLKSLLGIARQWSHKKFGIFAAKASESAALPLVVATPPRRLWYQAFLAETTETGSKNRCVFEATNVLRRKLRKN